MLANRTEIHADHRPVAGGKQRFCTIGSLDQRTIAARRATKLAKGFTAELTMSGGVLTATQRLAVEQASALAAIAEDAQARRLRLRQDHLVGGPPSRYECGNAGGEAAWHQGTRRRDAAPELGGVGPAGGPAAASGTPGCDEGSENASLSGSLSSSKGSR
jgi:hypothetical protein